MLYRIGFAVKARNPRDVAWRIQLATLRIPQRVACVLMLVLAAGLLLLACRHVADPGNSVAAEREYECVIEPQQIVKLASPVVGIIARLDVDRGDIVRKARSSARSRMESRPQPWRSPVRERTNDFNGEIRRGSRAVPAPQR